MGSVLCEHCTAVCCRYIALPIDKPRTRRDFDDLRWYLMHENVSIFVEDGDWYVQFFTRCKNLQADNRCGIYATRPEICREYKAGDCDYCGGDYGYEHWFTDSEQLETYARQRFAQRAARQARASDKPACPCHPRRRVGRPIHTRRGAPSKPVQLGLPR